MRIRGFNNRSHSGHALLLGYTRVIANMYWGQREKQEKIQTEARNESQNHFRGQF